MHEFLLIAAVMAASPTSTPSVKAGIEAWSRGDAAGAMANWGPLAARGNPDAMFNLGQLYRLGRGVPIDLGEAERWYTGAARAGHVDAQTQLGMMLFQNGDPRAAVAWLQRAADKGDARAQLLYGTALYNGDGVAKRDVLLAYSYVAKAAAQGLGPAKSTLAEMDRDIPPQLRRIALATPGANAVGRPKPILPMAAEKPASPSPSPSLSPRTVAVAPAASGNWRVQLGAFAQRAAADALFRKIASSLPGRQAYFVPAGGVTRLQAGPFASRAEAATACSALTARGQPCFPVAAR